MKYLTVLFLFILPCFSQERFVLPVDEAKKDLSFFAFREKLITAVKNRDANYVLSITDKKIKNGFGGEDGIENFKRQWEISSTKSELWKELLTVLTHGGTFDKRRRNTFYAPYLFTKFPEDLDQFEHQAIFGTSVNLRAKPDPNAPIIASLSYNIVKIDSQNSVYSSKSVEDVLWYKIETLGGLKGYVKPEFVRSSVDYRAGFEKIRGRWMLVFFLAGD